MYRYTLTALMAVAFASCPLAICTGAAEEEDAQAIFTQGMRALVVGEKEAAVGHLHEALRIEPDFLDAHWILIWYGPEEESNSHCETITRIDPHSEYSYVAKCLLEEKTVPVYGNPKARRFHLPSCLGLNLNEMIRFSSPEEAVAAWYEGCSWCNSDPNNLLAARRAEHTGRDDRFERVAGALQRDIAGHIGAARARGATGDAHRRRARSLSEAAKIRRIQRVRIIPHGGGEFTQMVTGDTVVSEAVREARRKEAGQENLLAAWNWGKAALHGYNARWSGVGLAEEMEDRQSELQDRRSARLEVETAACVRQALDIRQNGREQRAIELLMRATQLRPENRDYQELLDETISMWADELLTRARTQYDVGDFDSAITLASAVITLYPDDQEATGLIEAAQTCGLRRILEQADEFLNAGAYEDALEELQKADMLRMGTAPEIIQEAKQVRDNLMAQADNLFREGRYEEAQGLYEAALEMGENRSELILAQIKLCQDLPGITEWLDYAETSGTWAAYGGILRAAVGDGYNLDRMKQAAILLSDGPRQGQLIRSVLLELAGDLTGASEAYTRFAGGTQETTESTLAKANGYLAIAIEKLRAVPPVAFRSQRSQPEEVLPALAYALEAASLSPSSAECQAYASLLLTAIGHFDRANIHAQRALASEPTNTLAHVAMIVYHIGSEKTGPATEEAEWLLAHVDEVGYAHYLAACACQLAGNYREAQRELRIAGSRDRRFYFLVGSNASLWAGLGHCIKAVIKEFPVDANAHEPIGFDANALIAVLTISRPFQ